MSNDRRAGGGSGFGAAFALLIFVGAIVKFWVWIAAALVARADQQHAWVLAGDDRGVYGNYPAEQIS